MKRCDIASLMQCCGTANPQVARRHKLDNGHLAPLDDKALANNDLFLRERAGLEDVELPRDGVVEECLLCGRWKSKCRFCARLFCENCSAKSKSENDKLGCVCYNCCSKSEKPAHNDKGQTWKEEKLQAIRSSTRPPRTRSDGSRTPSERSYTASPVSLDSGSSRQYRESRSRPSSACSQHSTISTPSSVHAHAPPTHTYDSLSSTDAQARTDAKFYALLELLFAPDHVLLAGFLDSLSLRNMEYVTQLVVKVLEAAQLRRRWFQSAITSQVESSTDISTLFRENSTTSVMLRSYFTVVGAQHLLRTLGPFVGRLARDISSKPVEVDPERVTPEEAAHNMAHLLSQTQCLFDCILAGARSFPSRLRDSCYMLRQAVDAHFKGMGLAAVGVLYFLRFLCPALLAPVTFRIYDCKLSPDLSRALLLIAKPLQLMANGVCFSDREPHMLPLNAFITSNQPKLQQFLEDISSTPGTPVEDAAEAIPELELQGREVLDLYHQLCFRIEAIATYAGRQPRPNQDIDKFKALLRELTPAAGVPS